MEELPQTLCHLDVFPRNVFVVDGGHSVAIDWAFAGIAPISQELSALVGASLTFFEAHPSSGDELESQCLRGYLDGLRLGGWSGAADDVELAYRVSNVLRWCVGGIGPVVNLLEPSMHPFLEAGFGQPVEVVADMVAQVLDFEMTNVDWVRQRVGF